MTFSILFSKTLQYFVFKQIYWDLVWRTLQPMQNLIWFLYSWAIRGDSDTSISLYSNHALVVLGNVLKFLMILLTVVYGTPSLSLILALLRFYIKNRFKMANLCESFSLQCLWALRASKFSLYADAASFSLISEASFSSQYLQISKISCLSLMLRVFNWFLTSSIFG